MQRKQDFNLLYNFIFYAEKYEKRTFYFKQVMFSMSKSWFFLFSELACNKSKIWVIQIKMN